MNILQTSTPAPYLLLAPMQGVADCFVRKSLAWIGGFQEAVTEFLSVPMNAHVVSLCKNYHAEELTPIPLAAQIMGSDPYLMGQMALCLAQKGAPRIDINCGCPSRTVTGRGAGSSLLKDPSFLYTLAKTVVDICPVPVTIKMRSGYSDLSLFTENLLAAQESGISFLTLHPRTKIEGYAPPARWDLIAKAKEILSIPVVGNGDIRNVLDAIKMLQQTNCDALMIGRGALINPFLFRQIQAYFGIPYTATPPLLQKHLEVFLSALPEEMPEKTKIHKLKQRLGFLFQFSPYLEEQKTTMLRKEPASHKTLLEHALPILLKGFFEKTENLL